MRVQEDLLVDNSGLPQAAEDISLSSERLSEFSSAPIDDIPEAVRDNEEQSQPLNQRKPLILGLGIVGILALLTVPLVWFQAQSSTPLFQSSQTDASNGAIGSPANSDAANSNASPNANVATPADTLLGHYPYEEAPDAELTPITDDGSIVLRTVAAEKFVAMVDAAAAEGIKLVPLSGFRSQQEQEGVFFDVQAERKEGVTTRAEVSAPPGYSEHHTGYAIDIGDEFYPDADLKESFEDTPAFEWLQQNAMQYGFELSFPKDNIQGVSYEPWHWRFVGDRPSLETFYRSRSTQSSTPSP